MPNLKPKTEHLKATQFNRLDGELDIIKKSTSVNLERHVYEALQKLSGKEKAAWLRRVIREAAEREGLL